jgi:hypothetical protein
MLVQGLGVQCTELPRRKWYAGGYGKTDELGRDDVVVGPEIREVRTRSLSIFASSHGVACCYKGHRLCPDA